MVIQENDPISINENHKYLFSQNIEENNSHYCIKHNQNYKINSDLLLQNVSITW